MISLTRIAKWNQVCAFFTTDLFPANICLKMDWYGVEELMSVTWYQNHLVITPFAYTSVYHKLVRLIKKIVKKHFKSLIYSKSF